MSGRDDRKWTLTFTGKKVYPLAMDVSMVEVRDIAHSLSLQCRYNGHVRRFYSVAEHVTLMARHVFASNEIGERYEGINLEDSGIYGAGVGEIDRLWNIPRANLAKMILMHDAAETYITDIPRPLKYQLAWKKEDGTHVHIKEAEKNVERVVSEAFGLPFPWPKIIDEWDARMLTTERDNLLTFHPDWECPPVGLPVEIECWGPERAEHEFMQTYNRLWGGTWK